MRISSASSITSSPLDFSNISASKLQDVNVELYNQGKITFRQSGELALLDGWALRGVNNGQMPDEPINAYSSIDSIIKYQESNGIGDVKATVASWKGLKDALTTYSKNSVEEITKSSQTLNGNSSSNSSDIVDFTNMSTSQLRSWVNDQIKSKNMSVDQGTNLAMMSGHVSVTGNSLTNVNNDEPINFFEIAQNGISSAISRHDVNSIKMLEDALSTMKKYQNTSTDFTA